MNQELSTTATEPVCKHFTVGSKVVYNRRIYTVTAIRGERMFLTDGVSLFSVLPYALAGRGN